MAITEEQYKTALQEVEKLMATDKSPEMQSVFLNSAIS